MFSRRKDGVWGYCRVVAAREFFQRTLRKRTIDSSTNIIFMPQLVQPTYVYINFIHKPYKNNSFWYDIEQLVIIKSHLVKKQTTYSQGGVSHSQAVIFCHSAVTETMLPPNSTSTVLVTVLWADGRQMDIFFFSLRVVVRALLT